MGDESKLGYRAEIPRRGKVKTGGVTRAARGKSPFSVKIHGTKRPNSHSSGRAFGVHAWLTTLSLPVIRRIGMLSRAWKL